MFRNRLAPRWPVFNMRIQRRFGGDGWGVFSRQSHCQKRVRIMFWQIPSSRRPSKAQHNPSPGAIESLEKRRLLSVVTFAPVMQISDNATPDAVAVADMNGDGKLDLVTEDYQGSVNVLLGNADGAFTLKQSISDGLANGDGAIAVADFDSQNNDFPDVAVSGGNGVISILLGNGDGTLQAAQQISTIGAIHSLAAADLTGDGNMDLIAADSNGDISVFLGYGNGTFSAPIVTALNANGANQVVAAHFVNGGPMDLAVTNYSLGTVSILIGDGDGHFSLAANYSGVGSPSCVASADLTGDNNADLIVGAPAGITVFLGNGNGTFKAPVHDTAVSNIAFIATGDLNGDGIPDLVMSIQNYQYGGQLAVALGNGDGNFQTPEITSLGNYPQSPVVADVDGDGRPDIVVAVPDQYSVAEFLNTSNTLPGIAISPTGVVSASGTTGNDTITLLAANSELTVQVNSLSRTFTASIVTAIDVSGGAGNDTISIGTGVGAVSGNGGGGSDTIVASNHANDSLAGGAGPDSIVGGRGAQILDGGNGADTLVAGKGRETLTGDAGADSLIGGSGADLLLGGPGADTLVAGTGNNTLRGDGGPDSLDGSAGGSDLLAGGGNDTLIGDTSGGAGIDTLLGGAGVDHIVPGPHDSEPDGNS
jgi:Ca2+-binding RTX toxin-like protein